MDREQIVKGLEDEVLRLSRRIFHTGLEVKNTTTLQKIDAMEDSLHILQEALFYIRGDNDQ